MYWNSLIRNLIFIFLMKVALVNSQDIFDMFNDIKSQDVNKVDSIQTITNEKIQKTISIHKDEEACPSTFGNEYRTVLTAYRHMIRDWLDKFPSNNANDYRLLADISSNEFDRLNKFALSSNFDQKNVLHEVHVISDILKRMIHKIEEDNIESHSLHWSAWVRSFDVNMIIKTGFILFMIGMVSFICIRTHLHRGRWLTTLFIMAFIVSFVQNWYTLYQDAQAKVDEVLMKKLPKHCQGHSMGLFDMVKSKLGNLVHLPVNECLEYHKALRATPHSQVTPVQALSMTFAQLFVTPLGAIGESLSQFFAGTMLHVPFFLWPVIILVILFISIIIILMYSRYEVHLPFMMGSIRPSPQAIDINPPLTSMNNCPAIN